MNKSIANNKSLWQWLKSNTQKSVFQPLREHPCYLKELDSFIAYAGETLAIVPFSSFKGLTRPEKDCALNLKDGKILEEIKEPYWLLDISLITKLESSFFPADGLFIKIQTPSLREDHVYKALYEKEVFIHPRKWLKSNPFVSDPNQKSKLFSFPENTEFFAAVKGEKHLFIKNKFWSIYISNQNKA